MSARTGTMLLLALLGGCRLGDLLYLPPALTLYVSPGQLSDTATEGSAAPRDKDLVIQPAGADSVPWQSTLAQGRAWLSLTPTQGTAPAQLTAHLDPSNLPAGVHRDTIIVWTASDPADTVRVPVVLTISSAPPPPPPPPPPPATKLAFTTQPSNTEAGAPITPAVRVAAQDVNGGTVTGYSGSVTIDIATNPGGGTLAGATTVQAVNGVAIFSGLSIGDTGTGYTLSATASGLTGATSQAFDITPRPRPATRLIFMVHPETSRANQPVTPPVEVAALDDDGNIVTTFTGDITIGIAANVEGATVYGTLTVAAVNGVATFTNVRVDRIGVDFRLTAAFAGSGGPIATSNVFVVIL